MRGALVVAVALMLAGCMAGDTARDRADGEAKTSSSASTGTSTASQSANGTSSANGTAVAPNATSAGEFPRNVTALAWSESGTGDVAVRVVLASAANLRCSYTWTAAGHRPDAGPGFGLLQNNQSSSGGETASAQAGGQGGGLSEAGPVEGGGEGTHSIFSQVLEVILLVSGRDASGLQPHRLSYSLDCDGPFDVLDATRSDALELFGLGNLQATASGGVLVGGQVVLEGTTSFQTAGPMRAFLHAGGAGSGDWHLTGPGYDETFPLTGGTMYIGVDGAAGAWTGELTGLRGYSDGFWGGFFNLGEPFRPDFG